MLHSAYSTLHNDQRDFKNHKQFEKINLYLLPKRKFIFTLQNNYLKNKSTTWLWSLYNRMCTEHGFARIIIIYLSNK